MEDPLFVVGDDLDTIVAEMTKCRYWKPDVTKDREFAAKLKLEFPTLDIVGEVKNWVIWMDDHTQAKEVKARARLFRWLRTARGDYARGSAPTGGRGRPRVGIQPRRDEDFATGTTKHLAGW